MPIIADSLSVAAASTSPNDLVGKPGYLITKPSAISLFAVTDDTVSGEVQATLMIDNEQVYPNGPVPASPGTGQGPRDPEDNLLRNEAAAVGQVLSLTFTNKNATTAQNVRYRVDITPLS